MTKRKPDKPKRKNKTAQQLYDRLSGGAKAVIKALSSPPPEVGYTMADGKPLDFPPGWGRVDGSAFAPEPESLEFCEGKKAYHAMPIGGVPYAAGSQEWTDWWHGFRAAEYEYLHASSSETILDEAKSLVYGKRQADYGHPKSDFAKTALMWNGVLLPKLRENAEISVDDVALCMIGLKLGRLANKYTRDSAVDVAGYSATLAMLHEDDTV